MVRKVYNLHIRALFLKFSITVSNEFVSISSFVDTNFGLWKIPKKKELCVKLHNWSEQSISIDENYTGKRMTRAVIEWFLYMTCGAVLLRSVLRFRQEKLDCRVAIGGAPSTVVARPAAFSKKNGPTMPEIPTERRPFVGYSEYNFIDWSIETKMNLVRWFCWKNLGYF